MQMQSIIDFVFEWPLCLIASTVFVFFVQSTLRSKTGLEVPKKDARSADRDLNGGRKLSVDEESSYMDESILKQFRLPKGYVVDPKWGDAPLVSQCSLDNGDVICSSFHDFVGLVYQYDRDLECDVMLCSSRAKIAIEYDTIDGVLAAYKKCLLLAKQRDAHFCCMVSDYTCHSVSLFYFSLTYRYHSMIFDSTTLGACEIASHEQRSCKNGWEGGQQKKFCHKLKGQARLSGPDGMGPAKIHNNC